MGWGGAVGVEVMNAQCDCVVVVVIRFLDL